MIEQQQQTQQQQHVLRHAKKQHHYRRPCCCCEFFGLVNAMPLVVIMIMTVIASSSSTVSLVNGALFLHSTSSLLSKRATPLTTTTTTTTTNTHRSIMSSRQQQQNKDDDDDDDDDDGPSPFSVATITTTTPLAFSNKILGSRSTFAASLPTTSSISSTLVTTTPGGGYINVTGLPDEATTTTAQHVVATTTTWPLLLEKDEEDPNEKQENQPITSTSAATAAATTNSSSSKNSSSNNILTRQQVGRQRRLMWKRRHARSVSEGIRREKLPQLSIVLEKAENAAASVAAHLATSATSSFFPPSTISSSSSSISSRGEAYTTTSTISDGTTTLSAAAAAAAAAAVAVPANNNNSRRNWRRRGGGSDIAARTITGLISALAEEVNDLAVTVHARDDSPFWNKQVDAVKIQFSRLSFKPLRMGGVAYSLNNNNPNHYYGNVNGNNPNQYYGNVNVNGNNIVGDDAATSTATTTTTTAAPSAAETTSPMTLDETNILTNVFCADEAFRQMDADNSGTLDRDELAMALDLATSSSSLEDERRVVYELASDLLELYDFNGDGVVDRDEYQSMVEDMAALREAQEARQAETLARQEEELALLLSSSPSSSSSYGDDQSLQTWRPNIFGRAKNFILHSIFRRGGASSTLQPIRTEQYDSQDSTNGSRIGQQQQQQQQEVTDEMIRQVAKTVGCITVTDLKLDLRRLVFGAVPVLKHVTPGGPLILEPFTVTVAGSFNRNDITHSMLLDAGLRRLLGLVLRRRVRSLRDFEDLAVLFGRDWKMASSHAPMTDVTELTSVEFDQNNRLIMTGRATIRTRPDATTIEQAFKVRAKIGTNNDGHSIRLVEPELAFVWECPDFLEGGVEALCDVFNLKPPKRPEPIYSFFPVHSPFKTVEEDQKDGFNLGEDNRIHTIYIKDGALHFELSAVLRPGRFLGNHYIAFTIPNRTFIVTLDRVKEGMKSARKAKKAADERKKKEQAEQAAELFKQRLLSAQQRDNERFAVVDPHVLQRHQLEAEQQYGRAASDREDGDSEDTTRDSGSSNNRRTSQPKSFVGKFMDGYLQADRFDDEKQRKAALEAAIAAIDGSKWTAPIRDFFGRQSTATSNITALGANETLVESSPSSAEEV